MTKWETFYYTTLGTSTLCCLLCCYLESAVKTEKVVVFVVCLAGAAILGGVAMLLASLFSLHASSRDAKHEASATSLVTTIAMYVILWMTGVSLNIHGITFPAVVLFGIEVAASVILLLVMSGIQRSLQARAPLSDRGKNA